MEAQNKQAVAKKMNVPTDAIVELDLEGDRGTVQNTRQQPVGV